MSTLTLRRNWILSARKSRLDFFKLLFRSDGIGTVYLVLKNISLYTLLGIILVVLDMSRTGREDQLYICIYLA